MNNYIYIYIWCLVLGQLACRLPKYHCNVNKAVSVLFLKTKIKHLVSVQFKVQVPTLFTKPVYVGGATWLKVKVRGQLHCLWGKQLKIKGTKWKNWINE